MAIHLSVSEMSGLKHCRAGERNAGLINNEHVTLPLGNRRYLQFKLTRKEVVDLFTQASISN